MSKFNLNWKLHLIDLIVVIIGVSIAFAISNAAEKRKGQQEVITILNAMSNEMSQDIEIFRDHQIPRNTKIAAELDELIKMLYDDTYPEDSLAILIRRRISNYNWLLSRTTYESILQSGKIDLIQNLELKLNIRNLYEVRHSQTDFIMNQAISVRKQIKDHLDDRIDLLDDSSYLVLAKDRKFRNLLSRYLVFVEFKVREYKKNVEALNELNDQIIAELGDEYIQPDTE